MVLPKLLPTSPSHHLMGGHFTRNRFSYLSMASEREFNSNSETTIAFVKLTASKFEWGDLSTDTVMDIGCGRELYCAKTILESFPKVKTIIAIDINPIEIGEISFQSPQIQPLLADISNRNDIRPYEGKIDKAISTHVLHQNPNKENVFKNVYQLLKPGGQASFLFTSELGVYLVIEELRLDSKYKDYYKGGDVMNLYSSQLKDHHYRAMLDKIGFKVVEITEEKDYFPLEISEQVIEYLNEGVHEAFSVPPELIQEINKSASHIFQTKFCGQYIYAGTEMSIFVTKPTDSIAGCFSSED